MKILIEAITYLLNVFSSYYTLQETKTYMNNLKFNDS